ncbi:MAG: 50S ribosomal protein L33 [Candidatus Omnitrophota bacterium]|nr:50S ribosomal protein L33 [Candidatus Omnitrophota bacterium]
MQEAITFECTVCKNRNYHTTKNKKQNPDKLQRSKFCKFCKKHTPHKEMK